MVGNNHNRTFLGNHSRLRIFNPKTIKIIGLMIHVNIMSLNISVHPLKVKEPYKVEEEWRCVS